LEELSTGMSKVASAANTMGVDIDQLNAQLATIVSVTRQAPESVGTALKTVYARISDIESGISDEATLGEYTKQMAEMGINVLDANGKLRDQGEVIEEIGNKWTKMSREQQVALSQTMAGTRQYNNLLALFDNWSMYEKAMNTSANAAGTLQKQQDTYMESMEAHLEKLSTSGERVYQSLFNAESAKDLIDVLTEGVDLFANFVESIGGGGNLLMSLIPIMTHLFSGSIANSAATFVNNMRSAGQEAATLKSVLEGID
jgi:TP901 family phage tail tape measure protein